VKSFRLFNSACRSRRHSRSSRLIKLSEGVWRPAPKLQQTITHDHTHESAHYRLHHLQEIPRRVRGEEEVKMAAAIKALNARIRANPVTDYFCSTRECDPAMRSGGEETRFRNRRGEGIDMREDMMP
jgi:hypothetical protein